LLLDMLEELLRTHQAYCEILLKASAGRRYDA